MSAELAVRERESCQWERECASLLVEAEVAAPPGNQIPPCRSPLCQQYNIVSLAEAIRGISRGAP